MRVGLVWPCTRNYTIARPLSRDVKGFQRISMDFKEFQGISRDFKGFKVIQGISCKAHLFIPSISGISRISREFKVF